MPYVVPLPGHQFVVVRLVGIGHAVLEQHRGTETMAAEGLARMPVPVAPDEGEPVMAQLVTLTNHQLIVLLRTEVLLEEGGGGLDGAAKGLPPVPAPVAIPGKPVVAQLVCLPHYELMVIVYPILEEKHDKDSG